MKICPNCQRTYPNDDLNFCLDDGAVLTQAGAGVSPETILLNQPRTTAENNSYGNDMATQPSWNNSTPYTMQPKKSSSTWLWVIGILGAAIVLCGGGGFGMLAVIGTLNDNTNSANTANGSNTNTNSTSNPPETDTRTNVETLNLSKWVITKSDFGTTELKDNELIMSSRKKGFYYVLAGVKENKTEEATSSVTLRNIENADSVLGYGIVVHSDTTPLKQDYSFLIDTTKKRYRIVYHQPGKETAAINWTNSTAIKQGSSPNVLKVRDAGGKMDFYINDTFIASVKNTYGYRGGVIGLYSGDAVKIAFSKFEIRR